MKWLRQLFSRRRKFDELSEEIREHMREKTAEFIAGGTPPKEAAAAARREFGNMTLAEEDSREEWRWTLIENFLIDVRYALRTLRKSPAFTLVVVLTLALGIGANTAIFTLVDAVMLRMLPIEKPEELQQLKLINPQKGGEVSGGFTNPLWEQFRNRQDVFSTVFAWSTRRFNLSRGGPVHLADGMLVSADFFSGSGLQPAAGRLISAADDHRGCAGAVVLSHGYWQQRYGGAQSAIGSVLSLDNHAFQIIGVTPPGFFGMEVGEKFDVVLPICAADMFHGISVKPLDDRGYWWLQIAGRLKPGINTPQALARLTAMSAGVFADAMPVEWSAEARRNFSRRTLTAVPAGTGLSEYNLRSQFARPLQILMAVVGLVMLIACANIASLMLARAAGRSREIAVRRALGASRARLVSQLLTECVLLSLAGAVLGIFFARWGTAFLVRYLSTERSVVFLDLSPHVSVLVFTAGIAVFSAVLFGLLPALRSTKVSLTAAMKASHAVGVERPGRIGARKWIVVSQVALSLVLLVSAGLLLRSFAKLVTLDIGFDRNNVLLVRADLNAASVPANQQLAAYETIEQRLGALPGVISVGRCMVTPIEGGGWSQDIQTDWSAQLTEREAETWLNSVSPGHFDALRMTLLDGRNFATSDSENAPKVAIVNQILARRFFPGLNPIGKAIRLRMVSGQYGPPIQVVGIVKDSKYESLREETHPTAFLPDAQYPYPERPKAETYELRIATLPSAMLGPVQNTIGSVNKGISIEFRSLARQVNDSMVQERLLALLSGFFGALALLLATIGLYGTLSYLVSQRTSEFGVRMALGAQRVSILRLVMRDVLLVLSGGVVAGVGLSLAATRILQDLLFQLPARDAVTLGAAVGVLSAVAIAAGYLPARRATHVDPMVALRHE
jgi:putative ABC transport system permease protein